MFTIKPDLAALNKKLNGIINVIHSPALMTYVGRRIGAAMEGIIPPYPKASGKPLAKIYQRRRADGSTFLSKFKSAKQQGKVFSLIKQGKVPYRRTGTLGRSITSAIQSVSPSGVNVAIGTNIPYAPYVIGSNEEQSRYHAINWWQLDQVLAAHLPAIEEAGQKALVSGAQKILNGESL